MRILAQPAYLQHIRNTDPAAKLPERANPPSFWSSLLALVRPSLATKLEANKLYSKYKVTQEVFTVNGGTLRNLNPGSGSTRTLARRTKTLDTARTSDGALGASSSIVRIINLESPIVPESTVTAVITQSERDKLQRLGLTPQDQALTAVIIGIMGDYRFSALRGRERFGLESALSKEKIKIEGHVYHRLKFLQIVERLYRAPLDEMQKELLSYENNLKDEILKMVPGFFSDSLPLTYELAKRQLYMPGDKLGQIYVLGLLKDFYEVQDLKVQLNKLQSKKYSANDFLDMSSNLIANFVSDRASHIIRKACLANELLTLANGAQAIFRGLFNRCIAKAQQAITTYSFPQNQRILPEHQGIYSDKPTELISLSSPGVGSNQLRQFLFGLTMALRKDTDDPFSTPLGDKASKINRTHFSWLRKLWPSRDSASIEAYYQMREVTRAANLGLLRTSINDLAHLTTLIVGWFAKTIISSFTYVYLVILDIVKDFQWPALESSTTRSESAPPTPTATSPRSPTAPKAVLAKEASLLESARLHPYTPDDAFSKLIGGGEGFYNLMESFYTRSPNAAFWGSLMYLLSGASILAPDLVLRLSSSLKVLSAWTIPTANAIAKSELSQAISVAFINFKAVLLALDAIADGGDSVTGQIAVYLRHHLLQALAAAGIMIGAGYVLSYGGIPGVSETVRSDLGTLPVAEQTVLAAKILIVTKEVFESHGKESSLFARTLKLIFQIAFWPIRLVLIPFNLINLAIARRVRTKENERPSWLQALQPLQDALWFPLEASLRFADGLLRILMLLGRATKTAAKLLGDLLFNDLATLINRPASLLLAVAGGVLAGFFLFPFGGPLIIAAFALAGTLLGGIFHYLSGWGTLNAPAEAIIRLKHRVYGFFHTYVSNPAKLAVQFQRIKIARCLTRHYIPIALKRNCGLLPQESTTDTRPARARTGSTGFAPNPLRQVPALAVPAVTSVPEGRASATATARPLSAAMPPVLPAAPPESTEFINPMPEASAAARPRSTVRGARGGPLLSPLDALRREPVVSVDGRPPRQTRAPHAADSDMRAAGSAAPDLGLRRRAQSTVASLMPAPIDAWRAASEAAAGAGAGAPSVRVLQLPVEAAADADLANAACSRVHIGGSGASALRTASFPRRLFGRRHRSSSQGDRPETPAGPGPALAAGVASR